MKKGMGKGNRSGNMDKSGGLPQERTTRSQQKQNSAGQGQGLCPITKGKKK